MGFRSPLLVMGLTFLLITCASFTPTSAGTAAVASQEPPLLTFAVLSDTQIQSWNKQVQVRLRHALRDLAQNVPKTDVLVLNGDVTDGGVKDYDTLQSLLKQEPHPGQIFYNIGNHEYYQAWYNKEGQYDASAFPNGETDGASKSRFLQFAGLSGVYYEKIVEGYPFLFLGSEQYRQSNPDHFEDAYLSEGQLKWLKERMAYWSQTGKPIYVFLHQPLPTTVAGTSQCCTNNRAVIQHEALKSILTRYPQVIFFSGHTHLQLKSPNTIKRDGFTMINSSSVAEPWVTDGSGAEVPLGPGESEGLYVAVYKDRTEVKGRDFYRQRWVPEAQFSIPNLPQK